MSTDEVHVCFAPPVSVPSGAWDELADVLDDAERAQRDRFRIDADARAYVLAHGLRRILLARELGVDPHDLRFAADEKGKPVLATPVSTPLFFSHSRNRHAVAIAFTRCAPVGVDMEFVDAAGADFALLDPYMELPANGERQARTAADFYRAWTLLEAYWKASGEGLASGNPRITWRNHADREYEIAPCTRPGDWAHARGVALDGHHCIGTVVLLRPQAQAFESRAMKLVHCHSPFGLLPLCNAGAAP